MPSKQSEAVRRRWEASWLAMTQPDGNGPDDESWGDLTAEPREVDYLETVAGGRPAMWAVPKRSSPDRVLLCIHGGGLVSGSMYTHRKMFGHLAKATGVRALLVDYRLLPRVVRTRCRWMRWRSPTDGCWIRALRPATSRSLVIRSGAGWRSPWPCGPGIRVCRCPPRRR